jgi:hypothetical protein
LHVQRPYIDRWWRRMRRLTEGDRSFRQAPMSVTTVIALIAIGGGAVIAMTILSLVPLAAAVINLGGF